MSNQTTSEGLREYAEQWGHVKDAYVMTGKGYAFVTFEDVASARSFLEKREHELDGKVAEAKAAVPKDQGGSKLTKKMFVGGIGDVSDEAFASYFSQFGNAVTCTVLRRPDGSSKNYGFVTFDDEMSVEKCLLGQHTLNGRQVQVRRAHPRDSGGGERGGEGRAGDQGRGPGGPPPGPLMFAGQAGPQSQGQMPMGMPDPSAMLAMAQMHPAAFMGMPGMGMYGMMPGMMGMFPGMGGGGGAAGQGNDGPWSGGPSSSNWGGQGQPQGRRGEGGDRQPRQGGGREGRQDSRGPSGYGRANIGGGPSQRGGGNPSSQRFRPY
ncbi:Heterogeneous nuclear ribonucleoproteins A2/B1 [Auxenochlorella protothecoides]|uniref:Heterogeneous nuclear ribonucleoproteins A2/B1 n=2 Tax=Auxenochlorella protothecoides TaxID=3075 RepID=A0A087STW1_AUXPR|nr:Heterogeneous nuclear ribonucleoproteins A2/B1 [Auxenochlorella protothecoides]KFM29165.1 Heterogeneous nuclear ribonucleoproteins A2/B1 [Auxenochlorella protothecoides]